MKAAESFQANGHFTFPGIYSAAELAEMGLYLDQFLEESQHQDDQSSLHAIRRVLHEIPALLPLVLSPGLLQIIREIAPPGCFMTKSIYFDKPAGSNWFVAWHQDISISVTERCDREGYGQWTHKQGITGVVPPLPILQNTLTLRIHLDDTDASNGALRVVEGSHLQGILRKEISPWGPDREHLCAVPAGGVMLMRPLTMHASRRALAGTRRRVLHLEVCNQPLAKGLEWAEYLPLPSV